MNYNEIGYQELIKQITTKDSAFLCGNGFSINFDNEYKLSNLVKRLYKTHCHLKQYESYDIVASKEYETVLKENYRETKNALRINDETTFIALFCDAVVFARSIIGKESVLSWLKDSGFNSKLTFGLEQVDLIYSIDKQAKEKGEMYVNYEYWTVLIYYVLALKVAPPELYSLDANNLFVSAVLAGSRYSFLKEQLNGSNTYVDTSINGMFTYLRFLFTSNILLDGKSFNVTELGNWGRLDIERIASFLSKFNYLMTTNYDMLLENIVNYEVLHLHGSYSKQKKRVMSQSLGVYYNLVRYDLSTAVIGDYFLSKSFLQVTTKNMAKQPQNSDIEIYDQILEKVIREKSTQVIVIFGLNMDNDYHILRDIQFFLGTGKTETPYIVYCYFNETDKNNFINSFDKCITYSEELNNFIRDNIKVSIINSKQIIKEVFSKQTSDS